MWCVVLGFGFGYGIQRSNVRRAPRSRTYPRPRPIVGAPRPIACACLVLRRTVPGMLCCTTSVYISRDARVLFYIDVALRYALCGVAICIMRLYRYTGYGIRDMVYGMCVLLLCVYFVRRVLGLAASGFVFAFVRGVGRVSDWARGACAPVCLCALDGPAAVTGTGAGAGAGSRYCKLYMDAGCWRLWTVLGVGAQRGQPSHIRACIDANANAKPGEACACRTPAGC